MLRKILKNGCDLKFYIELVEITISGIRVARKKVFFK
jgi:hypothetical protein